MALVYRMSGIRLMRKKTVCRLAFRIWLFAFPALPLVRKSTLFAACWSYIQGCDLLLCVPDMRIRRSHARKYHMFTCCTFQAHSSGKKHECERRPLMPRIYHAGMSSIYNRARTIFSWLAFNKGRIPTYRERGDGGEKDDQNECSRGQNRQTDRQASSDPLAHSAVLVASPITSADSDLGARSSCSGPDAQSSRSNPLAESLTHICAPSSIYSICLISIRGFSSTA